MNDPARTLTVTLQGDVGGMIRGGARFDDDDPRVREGAPHGLLEIVERQRRAGVLHQARLRRERAVQLVAVDEDAPRQRDHRNVEAYRDAGPKVNLKQRSSQEQYLRLAQPALPDVHTG